MRDGRSDDASRAQRASLSQAPAGLATVSFQSRDHRDLLDIIDNLRSQGINRYVDLPQIIVCGEQSSGKSSVLEAISGVSFPTKDNLCTRFATELILRRHSADEIAVSIVPGLDRSEDEKAALRAFLRSIPSGSADLSEIIEDAKSAMGLDDVKKVFSTDILRVEVSGPTQPHLTMVDLPGLFQAGSRTQSDKDAKLVKSLVLTYMKHSRSIILAVVSAKNDFNNQAVTRYARKLDRDGIRTLGLITKPDALDPGSDSERAYVELANNKDVKFRLGWAVLRNRDYNSRGTSTAERDQAEEEFFSSGIWSNVNPALLGVSALRSRLSNVLKDQIIFQLPSVIEDVESGIADCSDRLERLGAPRRTLDEQRRYLFQISQTFTHLIKAAVDGAYTDVFFGSAKSSSGMRKRLRAVVQNTLSEFSEQMREEGHAREIVETVSKDDARQIARSEFIEEVKDLMKSSRGRELPGTFNPLIITEMFQEQCQPWQVLVDSLSNNMFMSANEAVDAVLDASSDETTADGIRREIIEPTMARLNRELKVKTAEILEPHRLGHPITYNHYLTETVQKVQSQRLKKDLESILGRYSRDGRGDMYANYEKLLQMVLEATEIDMDRYACSTAIDFMEAYYKVARKKVVDDISTLAIERCLIQKLPSLFSTDVVVGLKENLVTLIAAEKSDSVVERDRCTYKLKVLQDGLQELNRLKSHRYTLSSNQDADGDDDEQHAEGSDEEGDVDIDVGSDADPPPPPVETEQQEYQEPQSKYELEKEDELKKEDELEKKNEWALPLDSTKDKKRKKKGHMSQW